MYEELGNNVLLVDILPDKFRVKTGTRLQCALDWIETKWLALNYNQFTLMQIRMLTLANGKDNPVEQSFTVALST